MIKVPSPRGVDSELETTKSASFIGAEPQYITALFERTAARSLQPLAEAIAHRFEGFWEGNAFSALTYTKV
jgi:hypothetical protein